MQSEEELFGKFLKEKTRLEGNLLFFEDKPFTLLNLENGPDTVTMERLREIFRRRNK